VGKKALDENFLNIFLTSPPPPSPPPCGAGGTKNYLLSTTYLTLLGKKFVTGHHGNRVRVFLALESEGRQVGWVFARKEICDRASWQPCEFFGP